MTRRERLQGAITGTQIDRPPVALWRHFPQEDARADSLAQAHIRFFQTYEWDFLKVTPASGYYGDDWGLRAGYKPNREGVRHYIDRPIKRTLDWENLRRLDVSSGMYGREVHAINLIRQELREEVILSTIFSPLTIARTLAGDIALLRYLHEDPDALHEGLTIITEVTARFASETQRAGADGIFFATQCASTAYMSEEEYEEFGRPYDLQVLDAVMSADVRVLHLHGEKIMFDLVTDYPVDIINWHDRRTAPSLREARGRFSGCLAGGIDEMALESPPETISAQVRDAIAQVEGRRLVLAAGCVTPIDAPEASLRAVREAVEPA